MNLGGLKNGVWFAFDLFFEPRLTGHPQKQTRTARKKITKQTGTKPPPTPVNNLYPGWERSDPNDDLLASGTPQGLLHSWWLPALYKTWEVNSPIQSKPMRFRHARQGFKSKHMGTEPRCLHAPGCFRNPPYPPTGQRGPKAILGISAKPSETQSSSVQGSHRIA